MAHFYDRYGNPKYTLPTLDGKKVRDTNVKDARKLGLVPSVTDILKVSAKDALNEWIIGQILTAVLNSNYNVPKNGNSIQIKQWKSMIRQEAARFGKEAAEKGNIIHDNLENAFLGLSANMPVSQDEITKPVIDFITDKFGTGFIAEASFANSLGFGGKIDLHHPKRKIIIDFKTKQDKSFEKDLGYDDHVMQLAAYAYGLNFNKAHNELETLFQDGQYYNLFISNETPGKFKLIAWSLEEINRGWDMFYHLLCYWQLCKNYNSSFIMPHKEINTN